MALRVYNTLTRQKETFQTVVPGKVGMYVCGPTVYKPSHVGHMVGPVIFDTVKRYLTRLGYQVTFVVNVTDVDDKIINEAKKQNRDWKELAESVTADYLKNLKQLGVSGIDHFPRATEHIPEILNMIQGLIDKGYAYPAEGDVYFDVTKDPDYGKLCNRKPEDMEQGDDVEGSRRKRYKGDFALWKGAKPGEPKWDSPWGPGRPGWHIECSAMTMKLLGATLDIHGGGLDLQFPHHENELAQSESFTGQTFVRYWMHNGLMKIRSQGRKIKDDPNAPEGELEKMSKSLGNEIVVSRVLEKHSPETLRFLLLSTHYRSPIEYSEDRLSELKRALDAFHRLFERFERITGCSFFELVPRSLRQHEVAFKVEDQKSDTEERLLLGRNAYREFREAMDDDFNTAGAIAALFELVGRLNYFADQYGEFNDPATRAGSKFASFKEGIQILRDLSSILGLFTAASAKKDAGGDQLVTSLMQLLIDLRAECRKAKNFAMADTIRQRLAVLGVTLEDRQGGTTWRVG
jgi:cysteinyl-tRNA synthetase